MILDWLFENGKEDEYLLSSLIPIILDATEAEKDPRNIIFVFELYTKIGSNTSDSLLEPYSNQMFENLEMYYPIEFTPSKNSPSNLTKRDLADALNRAFTSNILLFDLLTETIISLNLTRQNKNK